ncbi:MAG: L-arabinose isomerase [Oscillospiraceae bacterium]|nr:L-arabinose isomerase [Oscillospiraceae bacterium]
MRKQLSDYEFWFVTGSQLLYGPDTLEQVEENSRNIVDAINSSRHIPCRLVQKPVMKTADEVTKLVRDANNSERCAGIITFMHTFSPSKMWINGVSLLQKPFCHLHTQFVRKIPNLGIDMDFMNLNQSAHGDREHGFLGARLRLPRKVIAGFWEDETVQCRLGDWMRSAYAVSVSKDLRVMRFGDNMREVAVTEGDKVEAQKVFGWQVNTWPVGLLAESIDSVTSADAEALLKEYTEEYRIGTRDIDAVQYQAKVELAIERLLIAEGCDAYTNTFEDLYGMLQLPGLASQRLMQKGYGFGGEGDWKTAAMTRIVKAMTEGKSGGTSFMEDYTYDLTAGDELSLGAHMLEVCPSIASNKAKIEVHALSIGGKSPPARLVFEGRPGPAILVSVIDMGGRFRMIVHDINCVEPICEMPNLPVARVMWRPEPNLLTGSECWILAGGAHHATLTYDACAEQMRDFARILGIEFIHITKNTDIEKLEEQLMMSDLLFKLKS